MPSSTWSIYRRPTLGLIAGSIAIIYSIPAFLYYVTLTGGESMMAFLYLYLFLAGVIAIMIDRLLTGAINNLLKISALEALLFGLASVSISIKLQYDSRKAIVNIINNKNNYTIIIKDSSGLSIDKFTRKGLFNKWIDIADNSGIIYLNDKGLSEYTVEYQGLGISQTVHGGGKPEYNYNWEFIYDGSKHKYTDKKIDSLVQVSLGPGPSLYNLNFRGF